MIIGYIIGYIILIGVIIFIGLEITKTIDNPSIYVFTWIIYIALALTILNIKTIAMFVESLQHKKGITGPIGIPGDRGPDGDSGVCESECFDKECEKGVIDMIKYVLSVPILLFDKVGFGNKPYLMLPETRRYDSNLFKDGITLNNLKSMKIPENCILTFYESNNFDSSGNKQEITNEDVEILSDLNKLKFKPMSLSVECVNIKSNGSLRPFEINNTSLLYTANRICHSKEYKTISPLKNGFVGVEYDKNLSGPDNLINYIVNIWKEWLRLLFNAGGLEFLEDEYGDQDFEWITGRKNPFEEIEKYDIFFWGMTKDFKRLLRGICSDPNKNNLHPTPDRPRLRVLETNNYDKIWDSGGSRFVGSVKNLLMIRPKEINYKNEKYYPIGDNIIIDNNVLNANIMKPYKYIKPVYKDYISNQFINPNNEIKNIDKENSNSVLNNGYKFNIKGVVVSGDVKGPIDYERVHDTSGYGSTICDKVNGDFKSFANFFTGRYNSKPHCGHKNNQPAEFWRPIAPPGYTCMGDITHVACYGKPKTGKESPIKCVPTECVSEIKDTDTVWNNYNNLKKHPSKIIKKGDAGFEQPLNKNSGHNLYRITQTSDDKSKIYTIQDKCLLPDSNLNGTGKDIKIDKDGVLPKRDFKYASPSFEYDYSILKFLKILPEGILTHKKTGKKYYIEHTDLIGLTDNYINSFIIIEHNKSDYKQYNKILGVYGKSEIKTNEIEEINRRNVWVVEFVEPDNLKNNMFRMKSLENGAYLGIKEQLNKKEIPIYKQISTPNQTYNLGPGFDKMDINDTIFTNFENPYGSSINILRNKKGLQNYSQRHKEEVGKRYLENKYDSKHIENNTIANYNNTAEFGWAPSRWTCVKSKLSKF
jgi:hypothetical protein